MRGRTKAGLGFIASLLMLGCSNYDLIQTTTDPKADEAEAAKEKKANPSADALAANQRFKDPSYLCAAPAAGLDLADAVTYDGQIAAMLKNSCTGCHSPTGKTAPDLTTFELAKANGAGIVEQVSGGLMPTSGALPSADQAIYKAWADGGFLQAAAATPPPATTPPATTTPKKPDPLESNRCPVPADPVPPPAIGAGGDDAGDGPKLTSYDDVKGLIDAECVTCHKAGGQSPDLSTFDAAKAAGARSGIRIAAGTMPTGGALNDADKALFKAWVDGGFAEKGN